MKLSAKQKKPMLMRTKKGFAFLCGGLTLCAAVLGLFPAVALADISSSPLTGDSANLLLWIVLGIISIGGLAAMLLWKKKQ